jgi:cobalt-zinc-cadmium efflux system protein
MIVVATIALVANVGTALLLYRSSKNSLNIESAFVHIVADALASVGVIVGGILVVFFDLYVVDPLLTAAISVYILVQSAQMLRQTTRILMESAPPGFDFDGLVATMESVDGACDVHHVHVWQLDEHRTACEAHVVIKKRDLEAMERIKREMKTRMREAFGIEHATLEFEFDACEGTQRQVIPHG